MQTCSYPGGQSPDLLRGTVWASLRHSDEDWNSEVSLRRLKAISWFLSPQGLLHPEHADSPVQVLLAGHQSLLGKGKPYSQWLETESFVPSLVFSQDLGSPVTSPGCEGSSDEHVEKHREFHLLGKLWLVITSSEMALLPPGWPLLTHKWPRTRPMVLVGSHGEAGQSHAHPSEHSQRSCIF